MRNITILQSRGRRLCKTIQADGSILGYDSVKTVDLHDEPIPDFTALESVLRELQPLWDCCVVRGGIADPQRTRGVRRLVRPDPETGDQPTLVDAPRSGAALDMDAVPAPSGIDLRDLAACGAAARSILPDAFHGAACLVGATAGHSLKPGLRLRLWFFFSRPLTGAEAQRWLRGAPGVDLSTLRPAQVIYTAAPIFAGRTDPLPSRLAYLPGDETVQVPPPEALAPLKHTPAPPRRVSAEGGNRYATRALASAALNIASAAVDARHPTAVSESWGLARLVRSGLLTESEVVRVVDEALQRAGKPSGEGASIAAWAVKHRQDTGTQPSVEGGR
ncbi:hypothetical protein [Roseomonas mucosa]|uniref:hypothetical protein n=1 Tax=Roseomonas mucosa TaxID=207340 RepID=UPI0030CC0D4A